MRFMRKYAQSLFPGLTSDQTTATTAVPLVHLLKSNDFLDYLGSQLVNMGPNSQATTEATKSSVDLGSGQLLTY
jgi:hypothetical protein